MSEIHVNNTNRQNFNNGVIIFLCWVYGRTPVAASQIFFENSNRIQKNVCFIEIDIIVLKINFEIFFLDAFSDLRINIIK